MNILIGVISDTHGLMRPEALKALKGVELIVHAGDVGTPDVLDELKTVSPVVAVRGNMDSGAWSQRLPLTEFINVGSLLLYALHDINRLDLEPAASGFSAVISGHTHRPLIDNRNGVTFLNPGSAGPKRPKLPVTVALLQIKGRSLMPRIVELNV